MDYKRKAPSFRRWYLNTTGKEVPTEPHWCEVCAIYGADCHYILYWQGAFESYEADWSEADAHVNARVRSIGDKWSEADAHVKTRLRFLREIDPNEIPF